MTILLAILPVLKQMSKKLLCRVKCTSSRNSRSTFLTRRKCTAYTNEEMAQTASFEWREFLVYQLDWTVSFADVCTRCSSQQSWLIVQTIGIPWILHCMVWPTESPFLYNGVQWLVWKQVLCKLTIYLCCCNSVFTCISVMQRWPPFNFGVVQHTWTYI